MLMFYRIIALTLFALVYVVGLIGNGLLIFIVFRQKNLRTVPNLLVVSLALGDFLFVLFCVPFGAVAYSLEYYPFSTIYCRFENFIINLSLGVSVFSLLALSIERYNVIAKPITSHANDPSIKLKLGVFLIWLISTVLALPETVYSGLMKETVIESNNKTTTLIYCLSPNQNSLLLNHKFMIIRQILRFIIYYLMPLLCICISYSLIAKTLFKNKDNIYSTNSLQTDEPRLSNMRNYRDIFQNHPLINQETKTRKQLQTRHKIAKIVLFLCLIFFLCWLPKQIHDFYWYIGVLVYSYDWNHFWQINKTIGLVLTYIYSCMNPCALYFLSSTFRHFYKRYLCFFRHTNRRHRHELGTLNDCGRHSSANHTITTIYYDLNRIKLPHNYHHHQQNP